MQIRKCGIYFRGGAKHDAAISTKIVDDFGFAAQWL